MDVGNTKDVEQQDATMHLTAEKKGRFIVKNIKSNDEKQQTPDQNELISHDEKNVIKTNDISNIPTKPIDEKSTEKLLSTAKLFEEKQVEKEKLIYDDRMVEKSTEDVSLDRAKAPKKSRFTIKTVPKDDEKERTEGSIPISTTNANTSSNKNVCATQPYFPSDQNNQTLIFSQPSTDQNHFTCLATQNSLSDSNLNNMGTTATSAATATATHLTTTNSEAHQLLVPIDQIKHVLEMNSQLITQLNGALSMSCSSSCLKCGYVGVNGAENPPIYRTITPGSMSILSHQDSSSTITSSKYLQPAVSELLSASNTDSLSTTNISTATGRPESKLAEPTSTVASNLPSSSSTTATAATQKPTHLNTTAILDRSTTIATATTGNGAATLAYSSSVSNLHTLSTITLPSTTSSSSSLTSNTKENSFPKINHLLSEVTKELKVAEKRIKDYQLEQKTLREKCQQLEDHVALEQSRSAALEEQLAKAHSKIKSLQAKQDSANTHEVNSSSNNSIISNNNNANNNNNNNSSNIKQQQQQQQQQVQSLPLVQPLHLQSSSPVDHLTPLSSSVAASTAANLTPGSNNNSNVFGTGNSNIHNQNTNIHTVNNSANNMGGNGLINMLSSSITSSSNSSNSSNHPSLLALSNHSPSPLGIISMHPSEQLDRMDGTSSSSSSSNISNISTHNSNATLLALNAGAVNASASASASNGRSLPASMLGGGGGGVLSQPCVSPGPGTALATGTGTGAPLAAALGSGTAPLATPVVPVTQTDATPLDELGSIAARDPWRDSDITPILQQQQQQSHHVLGLNGLNGLSSNNYNMTSGFH